MKYVAYSAPMEGDYLEFGVSSGHSFAKAYHHAQENKLKKMHFYAFDSFQGLPEITGVDAQGFAHAFWSKGTYSRTEREFTESVSAQGVDLAKVTITPGFFNEVLNAGTKRKLRLRKAAVIYIDCDLYESTVPVLNFITEYIQDGTVLIFDDWFCYKGNPRKGERRAFAEWKERNPSIGATEFVQFGWNGQSFLMHKG